MNRSSIFRFTALGISIIPAAVAQIHPHFGVEAGVPLTDTLMSSSFASFLGAASFSNRYNSETKRLLVGPTFRVDFPHGLGLEFDALYQRINYDNLSVNSGPGFFNQTFQQATANRWQFPVLVQYGFGVWKARGFVEAGPSISHFTDTKSNVTTISATPLSAASSSVTGPPGTWAGFTTGGGLDVRWNRLHLRPEFRYSHWFSPPAVFVASAIAIFPGGGTSVPQSIHLNQDETSFLLGITF